MKTEAASQTLEISASRPVFNESLIAAPARSGQNVAAHKTAMRDALSFSICLAVVAILTGTMLLYRVAVTVSAVTSGLFYAALAGMLFFAVRAVLLHRNRPTVEEEVSASVSQLN